MHDHCTVLHLVTRTRLTKFHLLRKLWESQNLYLSRNLAGFLTNKGWQDGGRGLLIPSTFAAWEFIILILLWQKLTLPFTAVTGFHPSSLWKYRNPLGCDYHMNILPWLLLVVAVVSIALPVFQFPALWGSSQQLYLNVKTTAEYYGLYLHQCLFQCFCRINTSLTVLQNIPVERLLDQSSNCSHLHCRSCTSSPWPCRAYSMCNWPA